MKRKLLSLLALICMLAVTAFAFASCNGGNGGGENSGEGGSEGGGAGEGDAAADSSTTYVNLNINPEISMIVDGNGTVVSAVGENEDAQALLYGEIGIEGASIEAATERIVDLAIQMGFISEENKAVEALVSSTNDEKGEELLGKINSKISAVGKKSGIEIKIDTEGAYTLLRELEAFKAEHPDNPRIKELSVADYKLALSASENGDITLEAAIELDDSELMGRLNDTYKKLDDFHTKAYNRAKAQAMALYEKNLAIELAGVYAKFYQQNITTHLDTFYLGAYYQMYASGAYGFSAIADGVELLMDPDSYELSEERVEELIGILGLSEDEAENLKDSDGKITLDSAKSYIDIYFKNLEASEEAAQIKNDLNAALDATEAEIKAQLTRLGAAYKPQIETAKLQAENYKSVFEQIASSNPFISITEEEKAELLKLYDEAMALVDKIIADGECDVEDIRAIAAKLEAGAAEILEKIDADLSDEEKATVEEMKTEIEAGFEDRRAEFEADLDKAAETSRSHLKGLKDKYLGKK